MRHGLMMTGAALLIALPAYAFAQTSGAGGAGVGNSDSSAGAPGNVHSAPNAAAGPYEGRSSVAVPGGLPPQGKEGNMTSTGESARGSNSGSAHPGE